MKTFSSFITLPTILLLTLMALGAGAAPGISNLQLWPDQSLLVIMTNANPGSYYALQTSTDLTTWQDEQTLLVPDVNRKLAATGMQNANRRFFRFVECASGSLSVSSDQATLAPIGIAASGTSAAVIGTLDFNAKLEDTLLMQVGLKLNYSEGGRSVDQVTLWDGNTQIGAAFFVGTNTNTTCVLSTRPLIQVGQTKTITMKADLVRIGNARVNYDSGHPQDTYGVGAISGRNINATGATYAQGLVVFKSYPIFLPQPISNIGLGDGRLLRFAVAAHAAGDVSLGKWSFLTAGTEAALQSASLYSYTDPGFSQPITGVAPDGNIGGVTSVTNGAPFSVYAKTVGGDQTTIVIPAGQVRYFELRGAFAQPLTPSSALSTSVWTGSDEIVRMAFNYNATEVFRTGSMVWSPNSFGMSVLTDNDWFNSWLVSGIAGVTCTRVR